MPTVSTGQCIAELQLEVASLTDTLHKAMNLILELGDYSKEQAECINYLVEQELKTGITIGDLQKKLPKYGHMPDRLKELEDSFEGFLKYYHKQQGIPRARKEMREHKGIEI